MVATTSDDDVCSWEDLEKRGHADSGCGLQPFFSLGAASVEHESNAIAFEGGVSDNVYTSAPFLTLPCSAVSLRT